MWYVIMNKKEAFREETKMQLKRFKLTGGGMLTVYACGADGEPADRLEETGIYVNLLPENDALRIKQGLAVYSETELRTVLEDLGE